MGKKIIIATMLILTLLLLMPSIPAIQQKTIEDKVESDIYPNEFTKLNEIKYPNLYDLFIRIIDFRYMRGIALQLFAHLCYEEGISTLFILLMEKRGIWLEESANAIFEIVMKISIRFGWGWENP